MKHIQSKPRTTKIAGHKIEWIYDIYEGGEPIDIKEISDRTKKYIIESMDRDNEKGYEPAGEGSVYWKIVS